MNLLDNREFVAIYICCSLINHSIIFSALLSSAGISSLPKNLSSCFTVGDLHFSIYAFRKVKSYNRIEFIPVRIFEIEIRS